MSACWSVAVDSCPVDVQTGAEIDVGGGAVDTSHACIKVEVNPCNIHVGRYSVTLHQVSFKVEETYKLYPTTKTRPARPT